MDKFNNFVRDGGSCKLPPGFRFQPTDEEVVFQYLARKIFSCPLPATVIPEIDNIFSFDPSELPGDHSEPDKYFFTNKESNYRNVNRSSRAITCGGYWRVIGLDKQISCSKRMMPMVGIKRTFVFYKGKNSCFTITDRFMHLYCIAVPINATCNIQQIKHSSDQGYCLVQIGKWDLCHIFLKKRIITKAEVLYDNGGTRSLIRNYDNFVTVEESDDSCASSSSSSSYDSDSDSSVLSEVSSSSVYSETK